MSDPQSIRPASPYTSPLPIVLGGGKQSPSATPPTDVADQAAARVDDLKKPQGGINPMPREAALDGARKRFAQGGTEGLERWLRREPRALAALAQMSDSALTRELSSELPFWKRATLTGAVEAYSATGMVEQMVVRTARSRIRPLAEAGVDRYIRAIDALQANPEPFIRQLRSAPEGSEAARIARALELDGTLSDYVQLDHVLQEREDKLRQFKGHLFGSTWEPADFPNSRARVMRAMGMHGAKEGSIAREAFGTPRQDASAPPADLVDAAGYVDMADDVLTMTRAGVAAYEAGGLVAMASSAEFVAALGPVGVGIAGLYFSYKLGEAIEQNHAERREMAREMGL
jgi:hypothetical protein